MHNFEGHQPFSKVSITVGDFKFKSFFISSKRTACSARSACFLIFCFSFRCLTFYKMTKISRVHMKGPSWIQRQRWIS